MRRYLGVIVILLNSPKITDAVIWRMAHVAASGAIHQRWEETKES